MSSVIQDYRARFPGIAVSLVERGTSQLIDGLRSGSIDAAFVRSPRPEPEGLAVLPMLEEEMLIALPSAHRLAACVTIRLAALAEEPFILFPRSNSSGLYDRIVSACEVAGFCPNVVQQAPEVASTVNLIAAGHGVSIVPASMQQMQPQGVTYRPICGNPPRAPSSLAHRRSDPSAAVRNPVALARRAASQAASWKMMPSV